MLEDFIKSCPYGVEKAVRYIYFSIPDYKRCGRLFRKTYDFLEKSQYWDKKRHEEYQICQIQKVIKHAYETVPYYKKTFDEYDIKPEQIQDFNDIKKIPFLTKEIIQNNLKDLVSLKYNKKYLQYFTTGGSTGVPMGFYIDKRYDKIIEHAYVAHIWKRIGYDVHKLNRFVIIRGTRPKNDLYEYKGRDLYLASHSLNEEKILKYIELINKFNPDYMNIFPTTLYILSDYIVDNNIKLNLSNLKAIMCSSENMFDYQREVIEKAFGVRIFCLYGHSEHSCIGGECEVSNYFHMQSEYGYTEIVKENGENVSGEDEIGEVVATGFNNYAFPFIRYKTKDYAINSNMTCTCGRNYKLIKGIQGREQEHVITKSKLKIAMSSLIFSNHLNAYGKIKKMQLEQNEIGKVTLKIIKKESFNDNDKQEIIETMQKVAKNDLDIEIKYVDNIELTKSGKHKFLIQNLDIFD